MEHGNPFGNGWFAFGGSVGGGGIGPNAADLPPVLGGAFSLETGWGSGGVPGFFGGFGRTFPVDLFATAHFNFWINPDTGQDYTLEINLQEDDNGDNAITPPDDDEFQFNCVVSPADPARWPAAAGSWSRSRWPTSSTTTPSCSAATACWTPIPVSRGGNGGLINAVFAVISNAGADATFRTDYWSFTDDPLDGDGDRVPDVLDNCPAVRQPRPGGQRRRRPRRRLRRRRRRRRRRRHASTTAR